MFTEKWKTSERKYGVIVERDVKVKLSDGIELNADVFRPDGTERFPAILGVHAYDQAPQSAFLKAQALSVAIGRAGGQEKGNAWIEAGDPYFYARRGYTHVIANVRGSGKSGGTYQFFGPQEQRDTCELIGWIARQPWCSGAVGMFGVSYFAMSQLYVASYKPPALKCLFAPWSANDLYRDGACHGGILNHTFWRMWARTSLHRGRPESDYRRRWGREKLQEAIALALQDEDLAGTPELAEILRAPEAFVNPLLLDFLLNPLDGPFWEERRAKHDEITVPTYLGADWGMYGLHLGGAFRSWEALKVPKKLLIGPPAYLDRPLYQLQYESLRWFDHWLKGADTGILEEPAVRLFLLGANTWKEAEAWPIPGTKWTPFYLHEDGLLLEREPWPNEKFSAFEDSPWERGHVDYATPKMVEETEVVGPAVANLYASTTDSEVLWHVSLRHVDPDGTERVLTRGWLRGSHREVDPKRSRPWAPVHPHTRAEPLTPGKVYEFSIAVLPTAVLLRKGARLTLRIGCADDQPTNPLEMIASGHIRRQSASRITVYHDADRPSHLLLPITRGNVLGTFISGAEPFL